MSEAQRMARRMDGTTLARQIRADVARRAAELRERFGRSPCLAVVLVGEDPASQVYVRGKHRACEEAGLRSRELRLPAATTQSELRGAVEGLNADAEVDGLLVQLPLPSQLDPAPVRSWIDPLKDVDGLHPENVGLLASGTPRFVPCTPAGCLRLLQSHEVATAGRRAVVLGRSLIVGRPMMALLSLKGVDATVTLCHSRSRDLPSICQEADILIVAAGQPGLVGASFVKPGAAVLDVGIHRIEDPSRPRGYRLVGDVAEEVATVAGLLSPVPGGIGPMTIAMLLENTLQAFELRQSPDAGVGR